MFRFFYILTYPFTLIALMLIKIYQLTLSKTGGVKCKFMPSCSRYGYLAIKEFGIFQGGYYTFLRLKRCNPKNCGGYDAVPLNIYGNYKWKC